MKDKNLEIATSMLNDGEEISYRVTKSKPAFYFFFALGLVISVGVIAALVYILPLPLSTISEQFTNEDYFYFSGLLFVATLMLWCLFYFYNDFKYADIFLTNNRLIYVKKETVKFINIEDVYKVKSSDSRGIESMFVYDLNNKIVFNNSSISEVASELERNFNIKISLKIQNVQEYNLTGIFEDEKLVFADGVFLHEKLFLNHPEYRNNSAKKEKKHHWLLDFAIFVVVLFFVNMVLSLLG